MSGSRWNSLFSVVRVLLVFGLVLSIVSIAKAVVTDDHARQQPDTLFSGPVEQNIVTFNPQSVSEGRPAGCAKRLVERAAECHPDGIRSQQTGL